MGAHFFKKLLREEAKKEAATIDMEQYGVEKVEVKTVVLGS